MTSNTMSDSPRFLRQIIFEAVASQNSTSSHIENSDVHHVHEENQGVSSLGVILVVTFTLVINLAFFFPAYLARRRRRRLYAQTAAARSLANSVEQGDAVRRLQSTDMRYGNIESWVVSRRVLHHDSLCSKLRDSAPACKKLRKIYAKQRTSTTETVDFSFEDADEECGINKTEHSDKNDDAEAASNCSISHECPICFDDLLPGDICSWSLEPSCRHVFHHVCIKEWLLKHEGCPFCRATFLPIDDPSMRVRSSNHSFRGSAAASQQVNLLLMAHNERCRSCYYCDDHGIVYLPRTRPSSISLAEWQTLEERGVCVPTRDELKRLRGSVNEGVDRDNKDADDSENPSTEPSSEELADTETPSSEESADTETPSQETPEETEMVPRDDTKTTTADHVIESQLYSPDYDVDPDDAIGMDMDDAPLDDQHLAESELGDIGLDVDDAPFTDPGRNGAEDAIHAQT